MARAGVAVAFGIALLNPARSAAQAAAPGTPVTAAAPSDADVAIAEGRLADAESMLFSASSAAPHEPSARGALGLFLASRGRLKVGSVLLEEARRFGGDATTIDARLARIYRWLGDWSSFATLKRYAATGAEHERALWLMTHRPGHGGADTATIALEPNEIAGLGRIVLVVGGASITADIDPAVDGLVLPSSPEVTAGSKQFGMHDSVSVAILYAVGIGAMRLTNVPVRLSPDARPTIGLDVLAAYAPAFDAGAHSVTLYAHPAPQQGDLLPFVLGFPGVRLVARPRQPLVAMESAAGRAALRGVRWTFDLRRGAIVVAP
jgi:hypothetical protein